MSTRSKPGPQPFLVIDLLLSRRSPLGHLQPASSSGPRRLRLDKILENLVPVFVKGSRRMPSQVSIETV